MGVLKRFISLLFTMTLCILCAGGSSVSAKDLVIFTSGGYEAYKDVERGIEDAAKRDPLAQRLGYVRVRSYDVSKGLDHPPKALGLDVKQLPLIFTIGTPATNFALENIHGVPIVYSLVTSWWRYSGRNATGVHLKISEALLARIFSKTIGADTIAVLCGKQWPLDKKLFSLSRLYDIHVYLFRIDKEHSVYDALKVISQKGIKGLLMVPDTAVYDSPQTIRFVLEWCKKNHVFVMGLSRAYLKMGADVAIEVPFYPIGEQVWAMGKEILLGKEVAEIPPEPPREFQVLVNEQTKETENLEPPQRIFGVPVVIVRP